MNATLKKQINLVVPVAIAGATGLFMYRKSKTAGTLIAAVLLSFLIAWVLTTQITKAIQDLQERPDHVNVSPDVAGTIDLSFDPKPYAQRLHADIYAPWYVWRDGGIYADLASLSNASLLKVYNYWTDNHYSEDNESMVKAMQGETYGNLNSTAHDAETIINRLKGMGAN